MKILKLSWAITAIYLFFALGTNASAKITIQQDVLSEGASLLFANTKSQLTTEEKNYIFELSGIALSDDKKQLKSSSSFATIKVNTYIFKTLSEKKEHVFLWYTVPSKKNILMFFAYQWNSSKSKNEFQKLFDELAQMPRFYSESSFYIPNYGTSYPSFYYNMGWQQTVAMPIRYWETKAYVALNDIVDLYRSNGETACADRLVKLKDESVTLQNSIDKNNEAALAKKIAAGKGNSAKFIGKYWQLGYYKKPYTVTKVGSAFYINYEDKPMIKNNPKFVYNAKDDRLEAWANNGNVQYKVVVEFDYRNSSIDIGPAERGLGAWLNLLRYK